MSELYRFNQVRNVNAARGYTFTLRAGESKLLQLSSKAEKELIIDKAVGVTSCDYGAIEMIQGDRRIRHTTAQDAPKNRRVRNEPIPVMWESLQLSRAGSVGWIAANGGLISNLKVWENITLPLWYHRKRDAIDTEKSLEHWLAVLGIKPTECADLMAAPPYSVEPWQRKLAGLLRALLQMPRVLVVDASIFDDVKAHVAQSWITAIDLYVEQGRAALVLADKATQLPWDIIE